MIIKNGHCNSGFTLIELIIVMAIFAVMSVVALPKISGFLSNERKDSALFSAYIAAITDDAYINKRNNYLLISLEKDSKTDSDILRDKYNSNSLQCLLFDEKNFSDNMNNLLKLRRFSNGFILSEVIFEGGKTISAGSVLIPFYSDGTSEAFTMRVVVDNREIFLKKYRNSKEVQKIESPL